MICKECGAYNSDRARFCKVCGASLLAPAADAPEEKAVVAAEDEAEHTEEPEVKPVRETERPTTRFVKGKDSADFDDAEEEEEEEDRKSRPQKGLFGKHAAKAPVEKEDEDEDDYEDEEEEEDVKPSRSRKGFFAKRRPAKDEDDEDEDDDEEEEVKSKKAAARVNLKKSPAPADEDEDEDEDEDDEEEEEEKDVKVYPSKKKSRPAKPSYDDEDDEDEDEDDDEDEEDDEDDYEEYESTPPRSKKHSSGGKSTVLVILLAIIAIILAALIALVVFCNNDPEKRKLLPAFLQFSACATEEAQPSEQTTAQAEVPAGYTEEGTEAPAVEEAEPEPAALTTPEPVQEYVPEEIDYTAGSMEEYVNDSGVECVKVKFYLMPGETMTAVLPNQDDMVYTNTSETYLDIGLEIPKDCYKPNAPLTSAEYTVTPVINITGTDGTVTQRDVGSFTMIFPEATLEITVPAEIPADGVMCPEGNVLRIEGKTNDHTVTVMANDQKLNVYAEGVIQGDYILPGEEAETVVITASGNNLVTTSRTITVLPYVFIPEPMELTVEGTVKDHKANTKKGTITLQGKVSPGSDMVASCDYEDIKCGSVLVNADGSYSVDVTFGSSTYGMFAIKLSSTQEGYEEGELTTYVYRMFDDKKSFINGLKPYKELPAKVTYADMLADPSAYGGFRVTGKVVAVTEEGEFSVVQMDVQIASKETKTMYIINMSSAWEPASNIGTTYKVYGTLNGLYSDGESLSIIGWFAQK